MDIDSKEFITRMHQGELHIIDVRETLEYHTFNMGGIHIPLGKLAERIDEFSFDSSDEIIVICQHGQRSKTAQQLLQEAGYSNVRNLTGGIIALNKQAR